MASAYASGALVKCRKVGAANWGNKSEAYEINVADAKANTPAYQGYMSGKKNKVTGKPLYKASKDYLDTAKGVKKEETAIESELLIQDWKKDDIKFTEVETVDLIKPEPLNPSDWRTDLGEMKRDEYGDPVGGCFSLRNKKQKILHQILLMNNILQQLLKVWHMVFLEDQVNHLDKWQHLVSKKRNQIHMVREQS